MSKNKLLFLLLFFISLSYSQVKQPTVMVNARAQKDKILIRWAVNSPSEWQKANKKGFIVTRTTVLRDGNLLSKPEKIVLTPKPLVAEPLDSWMELVQKDNNAAIIAQSIYGESFEITAAKEGDLSKIVSMADELDQRYTFALYAADMSFTGAVKAGWGLLDTNVKKNEVYAYQVSVFESPKVKESSYMIGLKDYTVLPAPTDFIAIPDDKKVLLSWDYETFKRIYTSFMVEKSSDGINYAPIATTPLVNLNDKDDHPSKSMYYVDTLSVNDKIYQYRLYGITSFGEKGQITKPITATGVAAIVTAARLVDYNIVNSNEVNLEWEYPAASEGFIQGYEINLADNDKGPYKVVSKILPPSERKLNYKENLFPSNYFTISVVGKNNQRLTSQSMLVQPVDSIPPAKPIGLEGVIDSLGVVRLKWKPNLEKDLRGYRILKANTEGEEFVDIYHQSYLGNDYKDSVSLKMTNSKVFYRIAAEDMRFNISDPSEILVLDKPDKIPPAAPIFKDYDNKDGKVHLKWIRSYSEDIVGYSLRRREKGQEKWLEIKQINDTIQEFTDDRVENRKTYQYAILAKDKSNNWSSLDHSTITVNVLNFTPIKVITFLQGVADRENKKIVLTWDYAKNKGKILGVSIYKNAKGTPPTLWKELNSNVFTLEDKNLKINQELEYHFVPNLESDSPAKAETVTVIY
ncbi:fibronectin type III domain-containing protein [Flavobacterium geliluteum]|uniref:Fibronectin type III domain-containing protein n=1 Tax=Flavobacterium geliluteum TaxID=2816120 RepID=A0A941B2G3_9FLAO|nr:fibronectin type III domain-containing protein [Flavobacterium geliluteum]MBP4137443.1 fibronectin type III domain-containing protein [Flavobacterium geliluteum]